MSRRGPVLALDRGGLDDRGFTFVETLVVVIVISLIAGVLGLAVSAVIRNEGSVTTRVTETRDLQNLANFLPRDVASARVISTSATPTGECGSGGTPLLHLSWDEEWKGDLFTSRVTYREIGTTSKSLVRFECVDADPPSSFTVSQVYESVTFACPQEATVTGELVLAGGDRTITATSRNFPSTATCNPGP